MNHSACRQMGWLSLTLLVLVVGGCGRKAPDDANAALNAALSALPNGDTKAFIDRVVASQREEVTKKAQMPFFQAVKSHEIDNEFDMNVTDTSATILTMLYFDEMQDVHSILAFVMRKEGGAWWIDLEETIKRQIATNGAQAFKTWEIVLK